MFNEASLNILVRDVINLLYYKHRTENIFTSENTFTENTEQR